MSAFAAVLHFIFKGSEFIVLTMNFFVMFYNVCKGEISYHIHFKTVEFSFLLNGRCSLKCQTKPFERPLGCHLYKYMANNEDYFCNSSSSSNNNNNKVMALPPPFTLCHLHKTFVKS